MKKISLALLIGLLLSVGVMADVPTSMTSQQILRNQSTNALIDGTHTINYSLVRLSDSSLLWNESLNVELDNGIASSLLGKINAFSYTNFIEPVKWILNIDQGTGIEYNETPVGSARVAEYALKVNWTNVSVNSNVDIGGYNLSTIEEIVIDGDSKKLWLGDGQDSSVYYDGTDLTIVPDEVGSGVLDIENSELPCLECHL